jgi:hypothetical protein
MTETIQLQAPTATGPAAGTGRAGGVDGLREVGQEFKAVFLAQVLAQLNPGLGSNEPTPLHDIF